MAAELEKKAPTGAFFFWSPILYELLMGLLPTFVMGCFRAYP